MKRFINTFLAGCMAVFIMAACQPASGLPRTWIDQPLENSIFPLQSLTLQAHASDDDGVREIRFFIDSEEFITVAVDGRRMEHAAVEWLPPAYGTYVIAAMAVDQNGLEGPRAASQVMIAEDAGGVAPLPLPGEEVVPMPLPAPQGEGETEGDDEAGIAPLPLPGQQDTEENTGPVVVANRNANCRKGPGTEYDIEGALLLNEQADIIGRLADNSWFLITLPDSAFNCWISAITVDTQGNTAAVSIASAPPPPAQDPPPGDTTPPGIFGAAPDKTTMCASETVNSNVVAYDEGGIARVYATWQIKNSSGTVVESGTVEYGPITAVENGWTGVFGTFTYAGTLSIKGKVVDNAGNTASFSHSVTINCS